MVDGMHEKNPLEGSSASTKAHMGKEPPEKRETFLNVRLHPDVEEKVSQEAHHSRRGKKIREKLTT